MEKGCIYALWTAQTLTCRAGLWRTVGRGQITDSGQYRGVMVWSEDRDFPLDGVRALLLTWRNLTGK